MNEVCGQPRIIPKIVKLVPALCLTAAFQFGACAQVVSDSPNTQAELKVMEQVSNDSAAKLIETAGATFSLSALRTEMLCSPKALLDVFTAGSENAASKFIAPVVNEPKVPLPQPKVEIAVRPNEKRLNNVSFAEPDEDSKHAPKTFKASAYAIQGRTRSGVKTQQGTIAADPRVLPLGTVVQVNAGKYSGVYTVHDTGGAIKGNRLDVWMPTTKEARRFGRRNIKLVVLRYPGQNKGPEKSQPQK